MLRIFLSVMERCLRKHSPACLVDAWLGAVAFIHRFGVSLNEHVHLHCCVIAAVPPVIAKLGKLSPYWRGDGPVTHPEQTFLPEYA
ncbi:MAG: transposase [Candidatus Accumulibacter sp.]|uniref:Transposase n=1 Tax=Candidatus Accumulibacter proximus TaxID=2954385 RepID=A0A935PYK4_9PROT|nr:transposase [Candidatus Accumulibacter proximus]